MTKPASKYVRDIARRKARFGCPLGGYLILYDNLHSGDACQLIRYQKLDLPSVAFSDLLLIGRLAAPLSLCNKIGAMLPMAPCGRSSIFLAASASVGNQCVFKHSLRNRLFSPKRDGANPFRSTPKSWQRLSAEMRMLGENRCANMSHIRVLQISPADRSGVSPVAIAKCSKTHMANHFWAFA